MIHVGCCGFPVSRQKYFSVFNTVELQNTFYELPTESEAQNLRNSIPENAIVHMKAWQAITHPHTSPTWRRMKRKPSGNLENYGFLKPTKENFEAWDRIARIAKILNVRVIVIQTPPSFTYSEDNLRNVKEFFSSISGDNFVIGWEPRGDWNKHIDVIQRLVQDLDIVHIVDILKVRPIGIEHKGILYTRLHGLGAEVNYRYRYSDEDLELLMKIISEYVGKVQEIYVLFNNVYMFSDALRFKELLHRHGFKVL